MSGLLFQNKYRDVLVNSILVNHGIRPAFLLQFADYKEYDNDGFITTSLANEVKQLFPELILSTKYNGNQGIIISKTDYNGRTDIDVDTMGQILGYDYFCDEKFTQTDGTYFISFNVEERCENNLVEIFTVICDNITPKLLNSCYMFALSAKRLLHDYPHVDIKNVRYTITHQIKVTTIYDKLLNNQELNIYEIIELDNIILYNFYMIDNIDEADKFKKLLQKNNSSHNTIILMLLNNYINNPLESFYPLTNFPTKYKEITETLRKNYYELIKILERTKIQNETYYFV